MMTRNRRATRKLAGLLSAAFALSAAGCGIDDVEFNGGLFNAVGLGQKTKTAEPKMAQRSALVLPPNEQRLPEPGTPAGAESSDVASLADPDAAKNVDPEELARRQAAYCRENYEIPKSRGDDSADSAVGPAGPCRGSFLSSVKKWSSSDSAE